MEHSGWRIEVFDLRLVTGGEFASVGCFIMHLLLAVLRLPVYLP